MPKPQQRKDALSTLFAEPAEPGDALAGARQLPLALLDANPLQPRQVFDPRADADLAASIQADGVIEPVIVRPHPATPGRYLLVAGARRTRAARVAGLDTIPVIVREELDDLAAMFLTVQENLQRASLDIEDEGRQFQELLAWSGLSQRKLATRLGIGYNYLSRRVRLLKRPDLLAAVRAGTVPLNAALELLSDEHEEHPAPAVERSALDDAPLVPTLDTRVASEPAEGVSTRPADQATVSPGHSGLATGSVSPGHSAAALPFRWRPVQQFHTWLERTPPTSVPPDERAALRTQLATMRARLEAWEQALET